MSSATRYLSLIALSFGIAATAMSAAATDELPEGPIHDRHELMEDVGANAKKIGEAMKTGAFGDILEPARALKAAAAKVEPLFPEGSTHPKSRALDAIWTDWEGFKRANAEFAQATDALVTAAETDGALPPAVKRMFDSCKACHESFRAPED